MRAYFYILIVLLLAACGKETASFTDVCYVGDVPDSTVELDKDRYAGECPLTDPKLKPVKLGETETKIVCKYTAKFCGGKIQ